MGDAEVYQPVHMGGQWRTRSALLVASNGGDLSPHEGAVGDVVMQ
jgi:hypothetical protein